MKMKETGCSEKSAYKIQAPRNYPEENIQRTEHDKSLKSRTFLNVVHIVVFRVSYDSENQKRLFS